MARTLTSPGPERANRLIFFGAVGMALLAAVLVFAALANFGGGDSGTAIGDTVDVVVASEDIGAGREISADNTELASIPVNAMVDQAYTDAAAVVGTRALTPILRGDQLSPAKVVGEGKGDDGLGYVVPPNMRAMAVSVTEETSVGGLVLPGDRVDVIAVLDGTDANGADLTSGVLLLQNVEVLAVAQETLRPVSRVDENGDPITTDTADGAIAARDNNADPDPGAASVTLSVLADDAALLAAAQEDGTIYLSLRPVGDSGTTDNTQRFLP